jgi:ubiquinone/menaquinone biosynthesis C-methylase UbiE
VKYDATAAAAFYDEYGEREWTRFDKNGWLASLASHVHYLERFVAPSDRVLDIGCGPGRFTLELARIGARVVAADVSPGQLELHRKYVPDDAVESREVADVTDLSQFENDSFDAAVCFGGPLSYALERAPHAVTELTRVTRSGGHVLVSVMSLIGASLASTGGIAELVRLYGADTVRRVTNTGHLPSELNLRRHLEMRLYRWSELRALLEPYGEVVAAAATGMFPHDEAPPELLAELELDLGAEPGAIDVGNHILAVLRVA